MNRINLQVRSRLFTCRANFRQFLHFLLGSLVFAVVFVTVTMRLMSIFIALLVEVAWSIPSTPYNFTQFDDHFSASQSQFNQRYYTNTTSFKGPGSPILCIMGGEASIPPEVGILYPSVILLADRLGAAIIQPEHRFFGTSFPTTSSGVNGLSLLTPYQALADTATFIEGMRALFKCSGRNGEPRCPVITVGGSYPSWLAAMMRVRYPAVVDMAYAASAPMGFYSQAVDQYAYYKIVTDSAERASPGCADAVRGVMSQTLASADKDAISVGLNLCTPLPPYLEAGDGKLLRDEVSMVFMYTFADLNMANWPPPNTQLKAACDLMIASASAGTDAYTTLNTFLAGFSLQKSDSATSSSNCYNLSAQLPGGANATITSGDWSGVGSGADGESWDLETCQYLVEQIGTNNKTDMFLPRQWTIDWLREHCQRRFGLTPQPRTLPDEWGFDAATLPSVTSRIVFTNGLNDGWSAGGILTNLSDTLIVFNMPKGAHHSDLSHT